MPFISGYATDYVALFLFDEVFAEVFRIQMRKKNTLSIKSRKNKKEKRMEEN